MSKVVGNDSEIIHEECRRRQEVERAQTEMETWTRQYLCVGC